MPVSEICLVAVGSNELLANEFEDAVKLILGERITIKKYLSKDLTPQIKGDLFVCNKSQVNSLLKVVPIEKILILNLTPTTGFFVEVATVPAGEAVYVFNNQLEYSLHLIDVFEEMNISHIRFVPIAYEEMDEDTITGLLAKANYIAGVDRLLGAEGLYKYKTVLKPGVKLIKAKRVAAIGPACALVKWVFSRMQKNISDKVVLLTEDINKTMKTPDILGYEENLSAMSDEIKKLAAESGKIAESMQNALAQSIITQFNGRQSGEYTDGENAIEDVKMLIDKLEEFK